MEKEEYFNNKTLKNKTLIWKVLNTLAHYFENRQLKQK